MAAVIFLQCLSRLAKGTDYEWTPNRIGFSPTFPSKMTTKTDGALRSIDTKKAIIEAKRMV